MLVKRMGCVEHVTQIELTPLNSRAILDKLIELHRAL